MFFRSMNFTNFGDLGVFKIPLENFCSKGVPTYKQGRWNEILLSNLMASFLIFTAILKIELKVYLFNNHTLISWQ